MIVDNEYAPYKSVELHLRDWRFSGGADAARNETGCSKSLAIGQCKKGTATPTDNILGHEASIHEYVPNEV